MNNYLNIHLFERLHHHSPTISEAFEVRMEQFMKEGKINSYYRVRSAKRAIEKIVGNGFRLSDITPEWLADCELRWRREGKSPTTIVIYMKALKAEINEQARNGNFDIDMMPFGRGRYELPPAHSRKMALTKEQVTAIAYYKGNPTLEKYRDLWLFSYLCNGINFRDMIFLRYSNVYGDEISFYRSKTSHSLKAAKEIRASFTPMMREIITRWGNPYDGRQDTFLFKYASGNETPFEADALVRKVTSLCNRHLKQLAEILGIPVFTTYSARHSFATILNRNGVNIKYISDSLGHSSLKMTETYLAGFTEEDRLKYSKILL